MTLTQDRPIDRPSALVRVSCLDADSLLAFVDGKLDDHARSEAASHLVACRLCSDLVAAAADGEPGHSVSLVAEEDVEPGPRLTPGAAMGRYVILNLVGHGGTSEVYAAYDRRLDRRVALKVLHERQPSSMSEATASSRLLREAKAIARLSHPNVVVVYDAGEIDDRVFLAMEFIEGQTLAAWLSAARRGWRDILKVFASAGRGLAAAHEAGIVHRDFKPQNVMVGGDGVVRVMDFGLARDRIPGEDGVDTVVGWRPGLEAGLTAHTLALTRFGNLIGTPLYMAPEQFRAEVADGRTDQFGFCVALYEALYGERPFPADSLTTLREAVMKGVVRDPPPGSRVAAWLRRVLLRGLEPDRAHRFPSMESLLAALERDPTRTLRRIAPFAAVAMLLAGGGVFLRHASTRQAEMCRGGAGRVAGIWELATTTGASTPRRAAIGRAFSASARSRPYAGTIWERVSQLLDRYATDWTGMYTEACEATRVRGDQSEALLDLRMTCLQHRLSGLRALTELFATADAAMVDKAVDAVFALPPIDACADAKALQAALPPPNPAIRARVEELRQRLAEAKALGDAGRLREARDRSRPLVDAARAIGYGPLVAEAQLEAAFEAYINYSPEAEAETSKALLEGEAQGQDEVVATAAVMLRYILVSKGAYAEAWRLDALAEAALRRIGGHPRLRVWLLDSRAGVFGDEGRYAEALQTAQESAALAESKLGRDHRDFGVAMNSTAIALSDLDRPAEALVALDTALAIFTRNYGPGNPFLAIPLSNRGEILSALGRHQEALAEFQNALDQMTTHLGPEHPHLAFPLTGLGQSLEAEGRSREAIPFLERAVKLRTTNPTRLGRLQDSELALARALWEGGGDRRRAIDLARAAQRGYAATPALVPKARRAEEWLRLHVHGEGQARQIPASRVNPVQSHPREPGTKQD